MLRNLLVFCSAVWLSVIMCSTAGAQSITSGGIAGAVIDPSGAGVPNAEVALTNVSTNATLNTTTSPQGTFRFAFVAPGVYNITVKAPGFQRQERARMVVTAGQPSAADFQLQVATATESLEVSAAASVLQTENADVATTYSTEMVQNLPNPGNDLTYIAQTAPGVVMNTQAGYGNFVADGMPGISNLFNINGVNYNDPFLGLNNSGASNLLLGSNDIAEANVVNNAYSGHYGQYAGAQVTYITKSGTNDFHGNAVYNWNGRYLNANQFFNNSVGQDRPFNNFNQWMAGAQGPIWKDHTFFDVDYEGLHSLQPTNSTLNLIPSPQFQSATLANLAAHGHAAEVPFSQQAFGGYQKRRLPGFHRLACRRSLRARVPQHVAHSSDGVSVVRARRSGLG